MAHTLTFTSEFHVLVNDAVVSSPYTLQNGDVITIQVPVNSGAGYRFSAEYIEGTIGNVSTELLANDPPNLSVSDSDITLTATNPGGA